MQLPRRPGQWLSSGSYFWPHPYMLYFGVDVSSDKLDCAVVDEQGRRLMRARTFANDTAGVSELIGWARTTNPELPRSFVLEATAAYHELAANRLHWAGLVVSVVNPAHARSLARGLGMLSKTATIDALLLAQYVRPAKPRPWHPVAAPLQQFNAMLMRLDCLEANVRREQNRREQASVRYLRVRDRVHRFVHCLPAKPMQGDAPRHRWENPEPCCLARSRCPASHNSCGGRGNCQPHGGHPKELPL